MILERKQVVTEMKADMDKMRIKGYASTFGGLDEHGDTVEPTAFDKSIAEKFTPYEKSKGKIITLNQHKWEMPLGRPDVLKADTKGLYFESPVSSTTYGKDLLVLVNDGVVNKTSIGFNTKEFTYFELDERWYRRLIEIDLWEISPVTMPADDDTSVEAAKCAQMLFDEIKAGRMLSAKNFAVIENAIKSLQDVLEAARNDDKDDEKTLLGDLELLKEEMQSMAVK